MSSDLLSTDARCLAIILGGSAIWSIFTARCYAKRDTCRRRVSVRPSVCLCVSVTLRYCTKTAIRRITQIMPHDRPGTLVFKCMFCSCRISTEKRVARSLCHSRATCGNRFCKSLNCQSSVHVMLVKCLFFY